MENTAPAKMERRPMKKLAESDRELTEYVQEFHTATPAVGTTREDVMNPVFWSNVARYIKPLAKIHVMPKDGAWYGEYLVLYSDNLHVKLHELCYHELDAAKESGADVYIAKWISPPVKFGVIRKSDGDVVKAGFSTKADAVAYAQELQKRLA